MEKYIEVKLIVENNNCTLLTTFEEFEKKRENVLKQSYHYVRIDFIGICGHNSSAITTNFIKRQTGIRCKQCVKKNKKEILKIKNKNTNEIELESVKFLEQYIVNKYDIIRTKEGCRADLILRRASDLLYIPIQIKSTTQMSHGMYSFRCINKDYKNMLVICICVIDNKIWVIPHESIKNLQILNISINSKYNKYLVNDNNLLYNCIEDSGKNYFIDNIDTLLIPISNLQQREQIYVKKREMFINFLEYKYLEKQNTTTDFIVNNKKIQEKVAARRKDREKDNLLVHLSSNNGKMHNRARHFRAYRLGENEYYWINSSIDNRFWIIPEDILYEKGYISKPDETINKKVLSISISTDWVKEYQYDYDNINRERIENIFK